jgi:RNA polymerase sigma-70 factor (ECF subfamily)
MARGNRVTEDEQQRRFEETFRSNFDALLAYAVARVDLESAKDAVASAFLVAWRRRAEIPDPGLPWLIGVVRRTLADQRRSYERSTSLAKKLAAQPESFVGADNPTGPSTPEDVLVVAALRGLSERDQELLRLVAWDGLTNAEIAEALRAPRRVIALRLHRARRRFQEALQKSERSTMPISATSTSVTALSIDLEKQ